MDEVLNLIESASEGFPSYSFINRKFLFIRASQLYINNFQSFPPQCTREITEIFITFEEMFLSRFGSKIGGRIPCYLSCQKDGIKD